MIENYLQVLEESLFKKMNVLTLIETLNKEQEEILKHKNISEDKFDETIDRKGELIDDLNKLDEGFEQLYENIHKQLLDNKHIYKPQITKLQTMISDIINRSVSIQVQEARNKKLADTYFMNNRKNLKQGKRSSKVAMDYYKNMNQSQIEAPLFMDQKK